MSFNTWTLLRKDEVPSSCGRPIKTKWVWRIKKNEDGQPVRAKSRLTACGYSQRSGVDYFDTYAAVGNRTSLRIILSIVATNHMFMYQIDVKNAFLNGCLQEKIIMQQPQGFEDGSDKVCLLNRALY